MIDITNLTSLITAFRNETEQGSISPETLGALLQAIANELQNASSNQDQVKLASLYENLQTMGTCIIGLSQSTADRNNVLFNLSYFDPTAGLASALRDQVFIKQATTERAGAMRAQQVIDLNAAKKGVANLEDAVSNIESAMATTNANNETRFSDLEDNVNALDEVIQENSTNIDSLSSSINTLNSRVSVVPIRRGIITIDHTSITSPVANYFKYNMPDGYYEIVRAGYLIGHAVSYQYGNFRMFNVVGLCHINSNSFVYQETLAHILVRVAQNGQIVTNGTIDHVDLQNQINSMKPEVQSFSFADDTCSIAGKCVRQNSLCTVIGNAYIDAGQNEVSAILPFNATDEDLPELCIYYEDTMQWVKIHLYNDVNGTHISALIPEDFINGGEVNVSFSLSFIIKN